MVRATKVSQRAEASLVAPLDKEPHRARAEPHVAKRKHSRKSDKEEAVKEKDIVEDEQPVPKRQRKSKSAAVAPKDETMEVQETPVAAASPSEKKAKGQSRKRARDAEDEGEEIAGVAAAEQTPPTKRARHRRKEPAGKEAESLLRDGEPVAPVLDVAAGEADPIPADTLKDAGGDAINEGAAQSAADDAEERLARGEPVAPVLDVAPGEASTLPMDVATSVPADASVGPHAPPEESKEARVAALEKSMDAVEHQMHQLSEELGPHFHDEKSHPTGRPLKPSSAKRACGKKGGAAASLAAGITEDALSQDTLNTDISMASVEAQPSHSLPPEPIITPIEPSEDANPPAPLPEVPTAEKAVAETPRPAEQEKETDRTVTPPTEPYTPAPPPFPRDETSPFTATAATPAVETRAAEVPGAQQTEPEPELATEATPMALVSDREEVSNQEASTTTNATTSTTTTAATVPVVGPTMSRTSSGPMEPIELTPTTAPLTADTTTMAGVAGGIEYPLAPQVAAADGSSVAAPEETSAVGKWPTIETENSLKEPTYLPNDHASTAGTAPPRDVHQAPPPPAEATVQQESEPTPMDTSTPATEPLIGHDLSAVPPPVTEHVPIGSAAAGAPQTEGKDVAQYLEPHVHTGSEFLDWKMEHPEKFLGRPSMAQVDVDEKGETI